MWKNVHAMLSRYLGLGSLLTVVLVVVAGCAPIRVNPFGDESNIRDAGAAERDVPVQVTSQRELQRMQRYVDEHAVRTGIVAVLVMPEGDLVDCVETAKQPALLRPEMRDHVLQRFPSSGPRLDKPAAAEDVRPTGQAIVQSYGTTAPRCPEGSVPIQRLTLESLVRFQTLEDFLRKVPADIGPVGRPSSPRPKSQEGALDDPPRLGSTDLHQYATVRRNVANWGAESVLNLWRPYTELSKEFTLSQIWVARGDGDRLETVEVGWQKYKQKYGDWNSRLFIYFTPDNYGSGGCYNLQCNKFVQVNNSVYIAGAFSSYSTKNGDQKIVKLLWYKDGPRGHWWLRYFDTWVGYYPRELFDEAGLRDEGSEVTFGGELTNYKTDGRHTRTDMGSGRWPSESFGWAAYQRSIRYVDTDNFYRQATGMTSIVTDVSCYDLELGSSSGAWEQFFYFGGSGYNTECQ